MANKITVRSQSTKKKTPRAGGTRKRIHAGYTLAEPVTKAVAKIAKARGVSRSRAVEIILARALGVKQHVPTGWGSTK